MTADEVEQRKRIAGLTEEDAARIRALAPALRPHAAVFTEVFFRWLSRFDEARRLLSDPKLLAEARRLKSQHLEAMFDGVYGVDYARERLELGELYGKGELPP